MSEKSELIKFWVNLSGYYRQSIGDEIIAMYAYDCRDMTIEDLRKAFELYRTSNEAKYFPIPAVLKNMIRPPIDEDAEAHEVVALIMHCLSPFKSAQDAREYMGELPWEVVKSLGGWHSFGQRPPPDSFMQRDIFNMAKSKLVRARQGRADEKPALPGSNRLQIASQTHTDQPESTQRLGSLVSDALKGKSLK